jgi:hypothetical protein
MKLALVYPYFDNPGMLAKHYEFWSAYPDDIKADLECVVVDAGGISRADIVPRLDGLPPLRIYRIKEHVRWNQDAARNIGAHEAEHPWLLLTDMDHVVPLDCLRRAMAQRNSHKVYVFGRVDAPDLQPRYRGGVMHCHPNSYLMAKELYWKIGGYDERLVGYYGTDGPYRHRVTATVGRLWFLTDANLIRYSRDVIPDAATTSLTRKGEANDAERWRLEKARRTPDKIKVLTHPYERTL